MTESFERAADQQADARGQDGGKTAGGRSAPPRGGAGTADSSRARTAARPTGTTPIAQPSPAASNAWRPAKKNIALASTAGSLLAYLHLRLERPDQLDDDSADELAEQVLRMLGMTKQDANAIAHLPLPTVAVTPSD